MTPVKKDASALERELDAKNRELLGVQEMLAQVLKVVGTTEVPKESIANGMGDHVQIVIDDDIQADVFRFSLVHDE